MPEGDTIYRAAAMMHRALAGATVRAFESPLPTLAKFADDHSLVGRVVEGVEAKGKFLLVHFAGRLTLLTHMRMNGSWHLYRHGDRWRRPRSTMRSRIVTDEWEAVGFGLPIAEFHDERSLARSARLRALGPDPLAGDFSSDEAVARLCAAGDTPIEEALLDQKRIAGVGNVLKSEALFLAGIDPFAHAADLETAALRRLVDVSQRLLRENVVGLERPIIGRSAGSRVTTRSLDPRSKLFVYGRGGKPCRRCGTPILSRRAGAHARSTYWCPRCQQPTRDG
jgi:endonuclease-8